MPLILWIVSLSAGLIGGLKMSSSEDWDSLKKETKEWHASCLQEIQNANIDDIAKRDATEEVEINFRILNKDIAWAEQRYPTQMEDIMAQGPQRRCANIVKYKSQTNRRFVANGYK